MFAAYGWLPQTVRRYNRGMPLIVDGLAALDINTEKDWKEAVDAMWPTILVSSDGTQR